MSAVERCKFAKVCRDVLNKQGTGTVVCANRKCVTIFGFQRATNDPKVGKPHPIAGQLRCETVDGEIKAKNKRLGKSSVNKWMSAEVREKLESKLEELKKEAKEMGL